MSDLATLPPHRLFTRACSAIGATRVAELLNLNDRTCERMRTGKTPIRPRILRELAGHIERADLAQALVASADAMEAADA